MTSVTQYGGQYFGPEPSGQQPSGQQPSGQQPHGDPVFRRDAQPWDPAYPHPYAYGYAPGPFPPVPPTPPRPRSTWRRRGLIAAGMAAILGAGVVIGAVAYGPGSSTNGTAFGGGSNSTGNGNGGSGSNPRVLPTIPSPRIGNGNNHGNNGTNGNNGQRSTGAATDAQQVGVVDIYTVQKYNGAAAAGTGMVLTPSGEVLTNNHVIKGSTSIHVTVVATGASYPAHVVGTAPSKDIAVIQLTGASGLSVANLGNSSSVRVHDSVTGVGNAGGVGGTPSAATGTVLGVHKTISASDEGGLNAEKLHNMIITNAPIRSGDSGGPLYNAQNQVIGIDTAASTNGPHRGFAIPINTAVSLAGQIEKGIETSSIHIGYPGFLGITLVDPVTGGTTGSGAEVAGVLPGGAAAKAGIRSRDVITAVNGTAIRSGTQLQQTISSKQPGDKVSVTYVHPGTGRHTVTVTLGTGPAD